MSQRSELIQTIQDIENGLAMNPTGEILERLTSRLDRAKLKLAELDQKKSVEPSVNQGQSEETEKIKRAVLNPSLSIPALNETPGKLAADAKKEFESTMQKAGLLRPESNPVENKAFRESVMNTERRVIGTVTEAPAIPVPAVFITLSSGTKLMNRVEIMNMLKTWFKRVATSKAMEKGRFSDAYGGAMGQDTYKLFQGWNTIYNETQEGAAWPPLEDVFPGLGRASQSQKVNAEILWRWASNEK